MKQFKIIDCISNHDTIIITSNNNKNALKQFLRNYCMSVGMYEIHKRCNRWIMTSSFGSYFVAMPIN